MPANEAMELDPRYTTESSRRMTGREALMAGAGLFALVAVVLALEYWAGLL